MSVYPNTLGPRTLDIPTTIIPTMAPVAAPPFTTSDRSTLHTIEAFIPSNSPMIIPRIPISSNDSSIIWLVDVGGTILKKNEKYEFVNGWWIIPYMKWKIKAMFETTRLFTHYSPIFSHTFSWSNGMSWMQNSTKPRGSILSRTLAESSAEPLHELVIFAPKKRGKRPLFFFADFRIGFD